LGEIVLMSMVIAGAVQHSATKYSRKRKVIDTEKYLFTNVQTPMVGTPKILPPLKDLRA
jgi:hypothetical protein